MVEPARIQGPASVVARTVARCAAGMDAQEGKPRAVLLDALGTLLELEPPAPRLRTEIARRFGIDVSLEEAGRAVRAEIAYYREHILEGRDRADVARLRARCARVVQESLPAVLGARSLRDVEAALLAALEFTPFADARPALSELRRLGLRLVVVSNWDASLHDVLTQTGLGPLVDGTITSAELGAAKPDPALFRHGLAMAGIAPAAAWHVGDTVEEDVAGALAAGVTPVLLDRDGTLAASAPQGVRVIASLAELPGLVA